MITVKSQFVQQALAGITFALVVGTLSMIWPVILTLFLGVLLLLQILLCRTRDCRAVVGRGQQCADRLRLPSASRTSGDAFVTRSSGAVVSRRHCARREWAPG